MRSMKTGKATCLPEGMSVHSGELLDVHRVLGYRGMSTAYGLNGLGGVLGHCVDESVHACAAEQLAARKAVRLFPSAKGWFMMMP